MIVEVTLDAEALNYAREYLSHGVTLSTMLLKEVSLESGVFATVVPDSASRAAILDLRYGEIYTGADRSAGTIKAHVAELIATYLGDVAGTLRCAIFEDIVLHASDLQQPDTRRPQAPYITHHNEVYYYLVPPVGVIQSAEAIGEAYFCRFVGMLTETAVVSALRPSAVIATDDLATLAAHASHIFVGAYDGSGILVWRRQPPTIS